MPEANDWRDVLPRGYYALRLLADDDDRTVLGYLTVKKVNGKPASRGVTYLTERGAAAPATYVRDIERGVTAALGDLLLAEPDHFRQEFGRFTGKCGCCGKKLTDPESKTRGIGPDCWGRMGGGSRAA